MPSMEGHGALSLDITYLESSLIDELRYSFVPFQGDGEMQVADFGSSGTQIRKDNIPSGYYEFYLEALYQGQVVSRIFEVVWIHQNLLTAAQFHLDLEVDPVLDIVVYVKDYTHIWAWDDQMNYTGGTWPGEELEEGPPGWRTMNFPLVDSLNVVLSHNGSGQSSDYLLTQGAWWYDGQWYAENPEEPSPPAFIHVQPAPGVYSEQQEISLVSEHPEDLLFYTLDGSTPSPSSPLYTGPFSLEQTSMLKVISVRGGLITDVYSFDFTIDVNADLEAPGIEALREPGRSIDPLSLSFRISDNKTAPTKAYYTLDGTMPTQSSPLYFQGDASQGVVGPDFLIESTTTVRFLVVDGAGNTAQASYYYPIGEIIRSGRKDFREETVYFLMTARFYDGDLTNSRPSRVYESSGNADYNDPSWRGDFKGLIEKLDYIKALGFSAIWITPPVLNRNYYDYHGYHGWDFTRIDGRLESPGASYQDLINEVHARDMKIIQDIVLNHSGRYGLKDQAPIVYWGDRDDPHWGKDSEMNYYDEYNPDFEYDGVSIEPWSGKSYYNGDLWSKEFPSYVTWDPVDEYYYWNGSTYSHQDKPGLWGKKSSYSSPEGLPIYHFQWPGMYESQFVLMDPEWYHNFWLKNWEDYTSQYGTIHEDCLDLDTESPVVQDYLIDAYSRYIEMGVDGFRIDTVKHISRNTFNRRFNPAFHQAAALSGNDNFYMVGEVCVRDHGVWNKGNPALSVPFYTWKERSTFSEDDREADFEAYIYETTLGPENQPTSLNHLMDGNDYRVPDYSEFSGMHVIDFRMHWNFGSAHSAFGVRDGDHFTNDATWNMSYVESHDYSPVEVGNSLYARVSDMDAMAENWSLMFTWRGIPTIFYGNEILFKGGEIIDEGPNRALENSGRAYFGDHMEGSLEVQDFGQYSQATGEVAQTLAHPLAQHVRQLNILRRSIPALQKGQYSTEGVSGEMAFKRRFTDPSAAVDSYVLVTISSDAQFTGILNGTYVDALTGESYIVEDGRIQLSCNGKGNLRVLVLDLPGNPAPGKVIESTQWIQ